MGGGGTLLPTLPHLTRRDPRWEEEGPSARREYRRQQIREISAFATSVVAVVAAGAVVAARIIGGLGPH
jgi:hypothetical protein